MAASRTLPLEPTSCTLGLATASQPLLTSQPQPHLPARYLSTAEDHRVKQQKYKLLPDIVYIKVSTIIQEVGLEFKHEGRSGSAAECTLSEEAHDRIMGHNFATYT